MKKIIEYCVHLKYIIAISLVVVCGLIYGWNRFHNQNAVEQQSLNILSESDESLSESLKESDGTDKDDGKTSDAKENIEKQSDLSDQKSSTDNLVYVYVCGCVMSPGVYQCQPEARIYELIDQAGGFTNEADRTYLNLVERISDGQKLYIPSQSEHLSADQPKDATKSKVNINTASKEQLMTLPGVGESKAKDIIESRNSKGRFEKTEDIMRIPGIKESAFNKIKDLISTN